MRLSSLLFLRRRAGDEEILAPKRNILNVIDAMI
jgi:hypothetical protein